MGVCGGRAGPVLATRWRASALRGPRSRRSALHLRSRQRPDPGVRQAGHPEAGDSGQARNRLFAASRRHARSIGHRVCTRRGVFRPERPLHPRHRHRKRSPVDPRPGGRSSLRSSTDRRRLRQRGAQRRQLHVVARLGGDSKGNLYTAETVDGRRLQKFIPEGKVRRKTSNRIWEARTTSRSRLRRNDLGRVVPQKG